MKKQWKRQRAKGVRMELSGKKKGAEKTRNRGRRQELEREGRGLQLQESERKTNREKKTEEMKDEEP